MRPTDTVEKDPLSRAEFWQRVAGVSFGVWSLMIPLGVWMLTSTFERTAVISRDSAAEFIVFVRRFDDYVLLTERRMTIVEERQASVLKTLDEVGTKIDTVENRLGLHQQGYAPSKEPKR
jgi:hypothetical protein